MLTQPAPLYDIAQKLRAGTLDLFDYIHQTCSWLGAVEPAIQALIPEHNRKQRLLENAQRLLRQYPDSESRPPLFGVLIGVKDIFIADGFPMRAGSTLPAEEFEGAQASSVSKLLNAGAIILGKTVTTEFAYFDPGPTRNPHNPAHTPGGSSSGSAAAVAAGLCSLSLGTQTIGSVIRPAAYCGIYGFKPSFGKIKLDGVLPCSQTVDHIGYFTQDIQGLALTASVMIPDWKGLPDTVTYPCVGIPEGPYLQQADRYTLSASQKHLAILKRAGTPIKHISIFNDIDTINALHKKLVAAEFAENHAALYKRYGHLYSTHSRDLLEQGLSVTDNEIRLAREKQQEVRQLLSDTMRREGINLWVCPTAPTPAPEGLASTGNPIMNLPWTYSGFPALSVPAGIGHNKLPLSLQLVADFGHDEELLQLAQAIERIANRPDCYNDGQTARPREQATRL